MIYLEKTCHVCSSRCHTLHSLAYCIGFANFKVLQLLVEVALGLQVLRLNLVFAAFAVDSNLRSGICDCLSVGGFGRGNTFLRATHDSSTLQPITVGQEVLIVIGEHLQEDKIRELLKEEETCQS